MSLTPQTGDKLPVVLGVLCQLRPVDDRFCLFIAAGVTATHMMTPALRILPSETLLVR